MIGLVVFFGAWELLVRVFDVRTLRAAAALDDPVRAGRPARLLLAQHPGHGQGGAARLPGGADRGPAVGGDHGPVPLPGAGLDAGGRAHPGHPDRGLRAVGRAVARAGPEAHRLHHRPHLPGAAALRRDERPALGRSGRARPDGDHRCARPARSCAGSACPYALPYLFSATRTCVGLALIGAVLAEWYALVDEGLGRRIQEAIDFNETRQLWASIYAVALLGGLAIVVLNLVERRVLALAPVDPHAPIDAPAACGRSRTARAVTLAALSSIWVPEPPSSHQVPAARWALAKTNRPPVLGGSYGAPAHHPARCCPVTLTTLAACGSDGGSQRLDRSGVLDGASGPLRRPRPRSRPPASSRRAARPTRPRDHHLPVRLRLLGVGLHRRGHRRPEERLLREDVPGRRSEGQLLHGQLPAGGGQRGPVRQRRLLRRGGGLHGRPTTPAWSWWPSTARPPSTRSSSRKARATALTDLEGQDHRRQGQDPTFGQGDAGPGRAGGGQGLHDRRHRGVRPARPHRAARPGRVPRLQVQRAGPARAGRGPLHPVRSVQGGHPGLVRGHLHQRRLPHRASDGRAGLRPGGHAGHGGRHRRP